MFKDMPVSRPTRRDVAVLAGVAPSTVTLVLNNRGESLGISESTSRRIKEAARELGYYPNFHIRSIRSGRTGNVGLYLRSNQWGNAMGYWALMVAMIQRAASRLDRQLLLHCAPEGISTEEGFASQAGGIVDGVMILNSGNDPIADRLMQTKLPAVEIGDAFSPLPLVAGDSYMGIQLVLQHLKAKGYRRPVYCNFESPFFLNADERRRSFVETVPGLFGVSDIERRTKEIPSSEKAFEWVMTMKEDVDVVVCTSDEIAYGVVEYARAAGLRVPEDLAVTGYDCLPTFAPSCVMTSVEPPNEEMAFLGLQKLLKLMEGQEVARSTILEPKLRIGNTT